MEGFGFTHTEERPLSYDYLKSLVAGHFLNHAISSWNWADCCARYPQLSTMEASLYRAISTKQIMVIDFEEHFNPAKSQNRFHRYYDGKGVQ